MEKEKQRLKDRFEKFIEPVPGAGCWLWTGSLRGAGYGQFSVKRSTAMNAHKASYLLYVGDVADGMQVLHRCDTKCCVNPSHLYLGTHQDNMSDAAKRGRVGGRKNKCGVRGVYFNHSLGGWMAYARKENKRIHLYWGPSFEEARNKRLAWERSAYAD